MPASSMIFRLKTGMINQKIEVRRKNMPLRSQTIIRRGINRLDDLIKNNESSGPALVAVSGVVASAKDSVNGAWQDFQSAAVAGDKEREERDETIRILLDWVQQWRPVILLLVPGAEANIRNMPPGAATPDDVIRVVEDMVALYLVAD